jgi:hypothetical protein
LSRKGYPLASFMHDARLTGGSSNVTCLQHEFSMNPT